MIKRNINRIWYIDPMVLIQSFCFVKLFLVAQLLQSLGPSQPRAILVMVHGLFSDRIWSYILCCVVFWMPLRGERGVPWEIGYNSCKVDPEHGFFARYLGCHNLKDIKAYVSTHSACGNFQRPQKISTPNIGSIKESPDTACMLESITTKQ